MKKIRCLTVLIVMLVLGTFVLHAGSNTNFRMSEIQRNKNQSQNSSAVRTEILSNRSGEKGSVVIRGTFDGEGTFIFQEDKILYRHASFDYPTSLTVNGRVWRNLDEPFDLGFVPVFDSAELVGKEGRNADTIRLTKFEDHVELYIYDSDGSSAQYRVSIAMDDATAIQRKKAEEQKKAETRKKSEEKRKSDDDGGEYFIALPRKDKNAKNEKASADAKNAPVVPREYGENEKLQGVLYFLTPKSNNGSAPTPNRTRQATTPSAVQKFVLGKWVKGSDPAGTIHYTELDQQFERHPAPSFSCFYQKSIPWEEGAELILTAAKREDFYDYDEFNNISGNGWVAIYSGYVIAPFTGKFRFLGIGDDAMLVRFNRQIVIDYGWHSLTTGISLDVGFNEDFFSTMSGNPKTTEDKRKIAGSPLYSKHVLEVSYPSIFNDHGLARSPVLSVQKGQIIPIDILLLEQCTVNFCMVLLVERLDSNGESVGDVRTVSLFRTTPELPDIPEDADASSDSSLPEFNPDGPVWKVVDANGKPIPPKKKP